MDGNFNYFGYDIYFHNGIWGSNGETKTILGEAIEFTVTPSNTFTAAVNDYTLNRSITNHPVIINGQVSDLRLYNAYTVDVVPDFSLITGDVSIDSNLLLSLVPEGGDSVPFYFNTTTNVALTLSDSSSSLGAGVLLRKGAGMTTASVAGTFVRYTLGNVFEGPEMYGWGSVDKLYLEQSTMLFNSDGSFTQTGTGWTTARKAAEREANYDGQIVIDTYFTLLPPLVESFSGDSTYSVRPDGTLIVSTDGGSMTNQVSADGNLIASVMCGNQGSSEAGSYLTVAVRQPQNMSTNAVEAVYFLVRFGEYYNANSSDIGIRRNQIETERVYVYLHSDNTFSIRADQWSVCNQMDNAHFHIYGDPVSANWFTTGPGKRTVSLISGTYTLSPNGIVTWTYRTGESGQSQLSANGEYLVFGESLFDSNYMGHSLNVGVRRPLQPPASNVTFGTPAARADGINITVSVPPNRPIEILYSDDLPSRTWYSGGVFTNATGILQFHDADAVGVTRRFYSATFAPW